MLKNSQSRYGMVSIIVHWLVAVTVFGLFAVGFLRETNGPCPTLFDEQLES